jgi:hypothetical protein
MASSEENVTTTSEPEAIELRTPEPRQDGLPPRPEIKR